MHAVRQSVGLLITVRKCGDIRWRAIHGSTIDGIDGATLFSSRKNICKAYLTAVDFNGSFLKSRSNSACSDHSRFNSVSIVKTTDRTKQPLSASVLKGCFAAPFSFGWELLPCGDSFPHW